MRGFVSGGGEWIRTTEVVDNRFTVCPLWPLGNSPIKYLVLYKRCARFLGTGPVPLELVNGLEPLTC